MSGSETIERRLRRIVRTLNERLPEEDVDHILEFLEVGEWGLAFETLCTQLYEYDIAVPAPILAELADLGKAMKLDPELWEILPQEP